MTQTLASLSWFSGLSQHRAHLLPPDWGSSRVCSEAGHTWLGWLSRVPLLTLIYRAALWPHKHLLERFLWPTEVHKTKLPPLQSLSDQPQTFFTPTPTLSSEPHPGMSQWPLSSFTAQCPLHVLPPNLFLGSPGPAVHLKPARPNQPPA